MKHFILLLIVTCLSLGACSNETQTSNGNSNTRQSENPQTQNNSSADISISDANDQVIAQVFLQGAPRIHYGNVTVKSKVGSSGKRKYIDQNGAVLAKIKSDSREKIKLKSENGDLIWKIKTKTDSVKIADNEEMERSFKVKIKEKSRSKLLINESEVGKATLSGSTVKITTSKAQVNVTGAQTHIASVMGFDDISLIHRLIILTELSQ